jgi:signal peptidase I
LNTFFTSQPKKTETSEGGLCPPPLPWEATQAEPELTTPPPSFPAPRKPSPSAGRQIGILAALIFFSALSYFVMSRFVVTAVVVEGKSMTPTLHDGDRYLLNRWAYQFRKPQRGDLVVIKDPGHSDFAVKRIVGLPLDSLELKEGKVYVNGRILAEPYLSKGTQTFSPDSENKFMVVGRNRYFVLGDNRFVSEDSRFYGAIRREQIVGMLKE